MAVLVQIRYTFKMQPTSEQQTSQLWDTLRPFVFGGIAGMTATMFVQPVDNIKVRIQTYSEQASLLRTNYKGPEPTNNIFKVGKDMVRKEGVKSLYKGLDAGLLRQLCYASVRLGAYKLAYQRKLESNQKAGKGKEITFFERVYLSLFSGLMGSIIGNPIDLSMVRFQSEWQFPPEQRRNYKNVFDALYRVGKEEGIKTYWRGFPSFALRVMAITCSQLTTFDQFKISINKYRGLEASDFYTRIMAVSLTGVVCCAAALPFDNIKMKMMKMAPDAEGNMPYKSVVDCFGKTIRREGVRGLWVGYFGFWCLGAPHTMISLIVMDYLHKFFGSKLMNKL